MSKINLQVVDRLTAVLITTLLSFCTDYKLFIKKGAGWPQITLANS